MTVDDELASGDRLNIRVDRNLTNIYKERLPENLELEARVCSSRSPRLDFSMQDQKLSMTANSMKQASVRLLKLKPEFYTQLTDREFGMLQQKDFKADFIEKEILQKLHRAAGKSEQPRIAGSRTGIAPGVFRRFGPALRTIQCLPGHRPDAPARHHAPGPAGLPPPQHGHGHQGRPGTDPVLAVRQPQRQRPGQNPVLPQGIMARMPCPWENRPQTACCSATGRSRNPTWSWPRMPTTATWPWPGSTAGPPSDREVTDHRLQRPGFLQARRHGPYRRHRQGIRFGKGLLAKGDNGYPGDHRARIGRRSKPTRCSSTAWGGFHYEFKSDPAGKKGRYQIQVRVADTQSWQGQHARDHRLLPAEHLGNDDLRHGRALPVQRTRSAPGSAALTWPATPWPAMDSLIGWRLDQATAKVFAADGPGALSLRPRPRPGAKRPAAATETTSWMPSGKYTLAIPMSTFRQTNYPGRISIFPRPANRPKARNSPPGPSHCFSRASS